MKKRILFCTESGHIKSGYGNYTRSILTRLYNTDKYEIAELSCYRTVGMLKEYPWKIYPNAVDQTDSRFQQYSSNPNNGFGQWRFDLVVADFKPDIVVDFRDIFMTNFQSTSVFREKFHLVLAPTIDSFPIRLEWLDLMKNCDTLLTHTKWAKENIEKLYKIPVDGVVMDSIDTNNFYPLNKVSIRNSVDIELDAFIIGSVMRNQKRKLIPDLLKITKTLVDNNKNTYLYLHTSYPESLGWDIPDLLIEHDVYNSVLFTYVCKNCKYWMPMKWKGAQATCPKCSKKQMTLSSVSNGISETELCKIYNIFDIYIQYSICEGFGIPPLEAASCGIPFLCTDHGAMAELADDLKGWKVPIASLFRDIDNQSDRVYPNNSICTNLIEKYRSLPYTDKLKLIDLQKSKLKDKYSWDYTSSEFERILDNIPTKDINRWAPIPDTEIEKIEKAIPKNQNNRDFVYYVIDNVLQAPHLKNTFFIQQLIMTLDNGYSSTSKGAVPYSQSDALKVLETIFNNKTTLNKFLEDSTIIKQNDFLVYE